MVKPNADIYLEAARRLGVAPSECMFLDDSKGHAEGATKNGGYALHVVISTGDDAQLEELRSQL
jgi:HAD superfamily hydrolase (TIGR01509 family)